ncbi:hypothetical protein [Parendozoicomonas haliclonae]|uniref:CobQ/CobB/MinD/ParA nucleotide binding domain protein n=1 Tax=Parendozoicomonas haliclonae TaxID=1960125 RepID=A0A1X7AKM2_9GAMM|nr:hypothetical protein [Parendozoicomonas haliclonae]SMA47537.1 hypothetical protein EHSB41UT_02453 [Parendozoicomonas haliclonae]
MLDFDDLKSDGSTDSKLLDRGSIQLIYQSEQCLQTVREALASEGLADPETLSGELMACFDQLAGSQAQLVIVEAGNMTSTDLTSDNLSEQLKLLRRLLPNQCAIILLGEDNRISIERQWRRRGIRYLYWPATRDDLIELVRECLAPTATRSTHSALRIGIVGAKGGAGCSFLAAQLARALAVETGQPGLLVDHAENGSNLHVMLGQSELEARSRETRTSLSGEPILDFVTASSLQIRISQHLNYLGSGASELNRQAVDLLAWDNSFVVEDGGSLLLSHNPEWLSSLNIVLLIIPATLSGLAQGRLFLEQLQNEYADGERNPRCILVLNHNQPGRQITRQLAEQYFKRTLQAELPWIDRCEDWLITGTLPESGCPKLAAPLNDLARTLLGKTQRDESLFNRLLHWLPESWSRRLG